MVTSDPVPPVLRAITRPLPETPDLIALAESGEPLLWIRGDRGCVGIGEVLRLSFRGPDRFREAATAWRRIADAAHIEDPVRLPGTGLVALGTFAFDSASDTESVLIVPRTLIARHRDRWWITEVAEVSAGGVVGAREAAGVVGAREAVSAGAAAEAGEGSPSGGQSSTKPDPDPRLDPGRSSRERDHAPSAAQGEAGAPVSVSECPAPAPPGEWPGVEFAAGDGAVDAYLAGVREAAHRIDTGGIEKIVLARQIAGQVPAGSDLRVPLRRLAERYLDCWTFAVDGLIGASPETLIRSTGGAVSARVLAGTRARHADRPQRDARARDELLTSTKEQHEHAFAVQSVVTALSPYVSELRTSEEPFPLRLPNVWHLATDLGATLDERSSALELVGALHPTAAVAGTPTSAAIAAISELEPFDRGRYSGAVGWIDAAGDGEWVIALRCGQLEPGPSNVARTLVASAGGGLVAGSDAEHELGETVSKFHPITEAFAR